SPARRRDAQSDMQGISIASFVGYSAIGNRPAHAAQAHKGLNARRRVRARKSRQWDAIHPEIVASFEVHCAPICVAPSRTWDGPRAISGTAARAKAWHDGRHGAGRESPHVPKLQEANERARHV